MSIFDDIGDSFDQIIDDDVKSTLVNFALDAAMGNVDDTRSFVVGTVSSGLASEAAGHFATLDNAPALTRANFVVV